MKKINFDKFKVTEPFEIEKTQTTYDLGLSKHEIKRQLKKTRRELGKLQDTMYAHGKYAVLICIQGMDTAGKDSLIREVFKDFNARGVVVHSFKTPTLLERKHDFLWRHYIALPARGKFGVFNRSHYENVLISRVHPKFVLAENIPGINSLAAIDEAFWEQRYHQIMEFEQIIQQNGMIIFKFFLNISKDEQKHRLLRRLNKPNKNWKFSPDDLDERELWYEYQKYYQKAINKTSTEKAPWFIIPSDDKATARAILAGILLEEMKKYKDIKEPELDDEIKEKISEYKKRLKND